MEFEHLVQVNDLSDARIPRLTRDQLWQGLVMRARHPEKFNDALKCRTEAVASHEFIRTIEAGGDSFCERVLLTPQQEILTSTLPGRAEIQAESSTRIEEPQPGHLFVRFSYRRELEAADREMEVGEYLKAAYVQLDVAAVRMIRLQAASLPS